MVIKNLIKKIPDFENTLPGKRNCMKGLSAITAGACLLALAASTKNLVIKDVSMSLAVSGAFLFGSYTAIGIGQIIKNEINTYRI